MYINSHYVVSGTPNSSSIYTSLQMIRSSSYPPNQTLDSSLHISTKHKSPSSLFIILLPPITITVILLNLASLKNLSRSFKWFKTILSPKSPHFTMSPQYSFQNPVHIQGHPTYLAEFLHITSSHSLRSSSSICLTVPSARLSTTGNGAFSRSASQLWNSLPTDIRNIHVFKSQLKIYLYKIACSL